MLVEIIIDVQNVNQIMLLGGEEEDLTDNVFALEAWWIKEIDVLNRIVVREL